MEAPKKSGLLACARLLRAHQWTKNGFCIAGLIFSGKWAESGAIQSAVWLFVLFSAASSSMYITNDVIDRDRDRLHPKKRFRAVASGAISVTAATTIALSLALVALIGGITLPLAAYTCLVIYMVVNVIYSLGAKHEPLMDTALIAFGFVLRLLSGVYAVNEIPTTWITLCTFFLALFLGFSKRRAELNDSLHIQGTEQRPVLARYSLSFLDSSVNAAATMTILSYALFTVTSGKNPSLIITVPIVYYGIMHYQMLVMIQEGAQEPDRIVLKDPKIQLCILIWLSSYLWITHGNVHLFH